MSKKHSMERAKAYREKYREEKSAATKDQVHWVGLILSFIVLLITVGLLYALDVAGLAFFGGAGIVAFFIGYAIGVYGFSVRSGKLRYDFASLFGILVGILFVILNLIPYTAYGSIFASLAKAGGNLSLIIGMGTFFVLFLYMVFGFISTRQAKV